MTRVDRRSHLFGWRWVKTIHPLSLRRKGDSGKSCCRDCWGTSNISTTQRYMHLDDRELADAQDLVE